MGRTQDFVPLVNKHLTLLRRSPDYRSLLETVSRMCNSGGQLPEQLLASAADAVLRPIAEDLSACSPGNNIAIFHMMVTHRQA